MVTTVELTHLFFKNGFKNRSRYRRYDKLSKVDVCLISITANQGIGYEIVRQLAQKGHTVYLGARNVERGQEAMYVIGSLAISASSLNPIH